MKPCSLCAALLDSSANVCPRCGIASTRAAPRRPGPVRRALAGAALLALAGAAVATAAPAVSAWRADASCEPERWVDWHVAMKRECLAPSYVCANMTSAKLFSDPEVADAYRAAFAGGDHATVAHLEALVGHMRAAYGCEGAADAFPAPAAPRAPRLPPGHPPIGGDHSAPARLPLFQAPEVLEI